MRWVWAIAAAVLLAALTAALWPSGQDAAVPVAVPASASEPAAAPAPVTTAPPAAEAPAAPSAPAPATTPPASPAPTATPDISAGAAARIERLDDRTVRLDGRFTVRGAGTESDPYDITWDLLGSVRDTVDAAAGRFVVPGRVSDLRGAWVRISGYWAPPLQVFETKDLMVMLNKWDGCCVGLPPTPFDSIEVSLARAVPVQGQHLFRYGSIRGRLTVEPFAAGGFLLGLYRLTDAVLEQSS
jgi:hypothetical protein